MGKIRMRHGGWRGWAEQSDTLDGKMHIGKQVDDPET